MLLFITVEAFLPQNSNLNSDGLNETLHAVHFQQLEPLDLCLELQIEFKLPQLGLSVAFTKKLLFEQTRELSYCLNVLLLRAEHVLRKRFPFLLRNLKPLPQFLDLCLEA